MSPGKSGNLRFGREFSLKKSPLIKRIVTTGSRYSGRLLDIRFVTEDDLCKQFCIRTPKRIGIAVTRNRLKRVVREAIRLRLDMFDNGLRAVIRVKYAPEGNVSAIVESDITGFLKNA